MAKENEPWIEAWDVTPMFPTLVWKLQLKADLREAMAARILAALEGIRRDLPRPASGQGWQSEQTLHESEEFQDLVACVNHAAKAILRFLRIGCDAFEITDQVVVRVKNGSLLVFPAYLQHSVDANMSEEERISISFNIMFSSFTEN